MTDAAVTLLVFISILMVCVAAGWAIWAIASGTDLLEKFREPSFPCTSCEGYAVGCDDDPETVTYGYKTMFIPGMRCAACPDSITGKPRLCFSMRGTRQCAKHARKVKDDGR